VKLVKKTVQWTVFEANAASMGERPGKRMVGDAGFEPATR
jgi:hypothetical protein